MTKVKKLPHSTRVFIRTQKAKIRGQFLDYKKQEELISELYKKAWGAQEKKEAKAKAKATKKAEVKPVPPTSSGAAKVKTQKAKVQPKYA